MPRVVTSGRTIQNSASSSAKPATSLSSRTVRSTRSSPSVKPTSSTTPTCTSRYRTSVSPAITPEASAKLMVIWGPRALMVCQATSPATISAASGTSQTRTAGANFPFEGRSICGAGMSSFIRFVPQKA